MINQYCPFIVA